MHSNIPTRHLGYNFRSRLEAKYAQFFNYLDLLWQYEPEDFKGWIPDFVIYGKNKLYVEIKPETDKDKLEPTFLKIQNTIPDLSINVCVLTPGFYNKYDKEFSLGYIRTKDAYYWDEISLKHTQNGFDFSDKYQCWNDRLSGEHNKYHVRDLVKEIFIESGNKVQWKKPKLRHSKFNHLEIL